MTLSVFSFTFWHWAPATLFVVFTVAAYVMAHPIKEYEETETRHEEA